MGLVRVLYPTRRNNVEITILKEEARGCGYRHSGPDGVGLYLVGDGWFEICERLPFPVDVCPCCGEGTKFSRGFTWITPEKMFAPNIVPRCDLDKIASHPNLAPKGLPMTNHNHRGCHICSPPAGKHGLMWVGAKFYSTGSFLQEAVARGISKRLASLPNGFKTGETIVYLAHKKAFGPAGEQLARAGIFTAFKPSRIEIVVDTTNPDDLPARAISIAKKLGGNARIVKIEPVYEQMDLLKGLE